MLFVGVMFFIALYRHADDIWSFLIRQTVGKRDRINQKLKLMYVDIPSSSETERSEKILRWLLLCAFAPAVIIFGICLPNFILGLVLFIPFFILGWYIPEWALEIYYRKRLKKFGNQLVDALTLMSSGLKSGLALGQAMQLVVDELPNPVSQEFNQVLSETRIGETLSGALEKLAVRIPSEEVEMFVSSISVLEDAGGNMASSFSTIAYVIRERLKLEQKISGMVAQTKVQGIFVISMFPGILLYQSLAEPDQMKLMTGSTLGLAVMGVAFVVWAFVIFLVFSLTRVKV